MTLDEDLIWEIRRALEEHFPKERAERLIDQIEVLAVVDPLDPRDGPDRVCSWCRTEQPCVGMKNHRRMCQGCSLRFYPNLVAARHGHASEIPTIAMVLSDVARVLRASGRDDADAIVAELGRRSAVKSGRLPRGFLPSCEGCSLPFERCQWTAALPGVDLCDACVNWAANAFFV